jgi:nicotinamide-nucleotide amidase
MNSDAELLKLATQVGKYLSETGRQLVTAESCTGGWIAKVLTDVSGSSQFYLGGAVTYSNALKQSLLQVNESTLLTHGAVSEATVREMALGALARLGGDLALAVSGIAGPGGALPDKPVGTVWFAWASRRRAFVESTVQIKHYDGDRETVRRASVAEALRGVLEV